jgi:hypothetical protein
VRNRNEIGIGAIGCELEIVKFAKNPINRPFMAMFQGFKLSKSIHTPKRERGFKNLGKTFICEVLKRKSDSFAKFAKESDERRESKLERRERI